MLSSELATSYWNQLKKHFLLNSRQLMIQLLGCSWEGEECPFMYRTGRNSSECTPAYLQPYAFQDHNNLCIWNEVEVWNQVSSSGDWNAVCKITWSIWAEYVLNYVHTTSRCNDLWTGIRFLPVYMWTTARCFLRTPGSCKSCTREFKKTKYTFEDQFIFGCKKDKDRIVF